MYEKVSKDLSFADRELEVLRFWKENRIFEKSIEARKGAETFTFYDRPPTANGKPHIGHVLTRAIKDLIPRYKTMKGYKVLRKAGWDTHGLPVEIEVEKSLGLKGKPDVDKYGVEPFIVKCRESVWKYKSEWEEMSDRVGFWADMENPYITYENSYIESVWWALKKIWDRGLIYRGHKVVPYCPRCGTALSSHEVAQGYQDVKEKSVFVKFKVKGKENEYFLAWTTTPWTLPSNVALNMNAKVVYARVKCGDEVYIMAEALVESVLGEGHEILDKRTGAEWEGCEYEPIFKYFDCTELGKRGHIVVCDSYVTLSDGTGIVHSAPAFGEDDYRVCKKNDLAFVQLVDEQGNFTEQVTDFARMFVKDADPLIIEHLKKSGALYKAAVYEHSYPFCWRCDTPLLYYARNAWFIEMTKVRDDLIKNNNIIKWMPEGIKTGRFGSFLEGVIDWGISRERYWGTPLPIWECECGHRHMVGSVAELKELSDNMPEELELHKPYIDGIQLNCQKCGGKMRRVPEVIDCWFDSGSMPFAQWHYPFENKELFEDNFPADFISEAIDQTRGWFYSLLAISTLIFEKSPYENVIVLGHVQDKDGIKMSKHKGNVIDPSEIIDKLGADAVRWYFYYGSAPWLPSRFFEEAVSEGQRKFMGTLWNSYAFYVLYADIDSFNPSEYSLDVKSLDVMDKWILSRLHTLIGIVDGFLSEYKITEASRALNDFVDELSNWYLRRNRERFWASGMESDKINAYMTLYTVLSELTKLSAPFTPFIAETIYRNIVANTDKDAPESVHLCGFPVKDESLIDSGLEKNMDFVLKIVTLGRSARNEANIKNRQPLGMMYVSAAGEAGLEGMYAKIVAEELNVKEIEFTDDVERFASYKIKPQLKTLGPKYGKLLPKISQYLANTDGGALVRQLKAGAAVISVDWNDVEITMDDVLIDAGRKEGFTGDSDKGVTVVLDTRLTDELIEEGFVREIVSKIQTMRKESGLLVLDRIFVYYKTTNTLAEIFTRNENAIKAEVLADGLIEGEAVEGVGYCKEWVLNGEDAILTVVKS